MNLSDTVKCEVIIIFGGGTRIRMKKSNKSIILLTSTVLALSSSPQFAMASTKVPDDLESSQFETEVQKKQLETIEVENNTSKVEQPEEGTQQEEGERLNDEEKQVDGNNLSDVQEEQETVPPTEEDETDSEVSLEESDQSTVDQQEQEPVEVEEIPGEDTTKKAESDEEQTSEVEAKVESNEPEKNKTEKEVVPSITTFSVQNDGTYQLEDTHEDIAEYKEKLNSIGFGGILVTDYFGDYTEKKVKEFQRSYGLPVNGKLDHATMAKIDEVYESTFQNGRSHPKIAEMKEKLNAIGFSGILVTDYFGNYTEKKVREFQRNYGLTVNGKLDKQTMSMIDEVYHSPYQVGNSDPGISELKEKLNRMGFSGILVTDYYGNYTAKKVKQFQEFAGIKANGIADSYTRAKLDHLIANGYKQGDRYQEIGDFKDKLNKIGFGGITVTDYYGSYTAKKVREFQSYYGLKETGRVNGETIDKIYEVYNNSYRQGIRDNDLKQIKRNLNRLDFGGITVTSYFGAYTEKQVKNFQSYYDLKPTGVIDEKTLDKMDKVLSSPFQVGKSHEDTSKLKQNLNRLGFDGITVTDYFGSYTEKQLKKFQDRYGLRAHGIADDVTLNKIDDLMSNGFKKGARHTGIKELKRDLNRLGFGKISVTSYFGDYSAKKVKEFQDFYGLKVTGQVNDATFDKIEEILNSPYQVKRSHPDISDIKMKLIALGFDGILVTDYFGSFTEKRVKDFQKSVNYPVSGIVDEKTLNKLNDLYTEPDYIHYDITLDEALDMQLKANPHPDTDENYAYVSKKWIKNGKVSSTSGLNVRKGPGTDYKKVGLLRHGTKVNIVGEYNDWYAIEHQDNEQWVYAFPSDVRYYLDPNNFINDARQKFQFLDLSKPSGASRTTLSRILDGKGSLEGEAQAFIDAGNKYGINEVYLLSHALLETGNGGSILATGVPVDKDGKITRDSKGVIAETSKTAEIVYNMFGYGANNSCPIDCGAKTAYDLGWTTPYKAIVGGAEHIKNKYINNGKNTIYKMRWNPSVMEEYHEAAYQYATDIGWASKQVITIADLYKQMDYYMVRLEVPVYGS